MFVPKLRAGVTGKSPLKGRPCRGTEKSLCLYPAAPQSWKKWNSAKEYKLA